MGENESEDGFDGRASIVPCPMSYRDTGFPVSVPPMVSRGVAIGFAASVMVIGATVILWAQAVFGTEPTAYPWKERAARIEGIADFRAGGTPLTREHDWVPLGYEQDPPVGGDHHPVWQQCMGNIYDAPIADEHAVHSLEHGAVWLAYHSDLMPEEVETLAGRIEGRPYTFMAPDDHLDAAVSLQAWGYQLKLDDVDDPRIEAFVRTLARNATLEPGAVCSGGTTATGTTPLTKDETTLRLILGG